MKRILIPVLLIAAAIAVVVMRPRLTPQAEAEPAAASRTVQTPERTKEQPGAASVRVASPQLATVNPTRTADELADEIQRLLATDDPAARDKVWLGLFPALLKRDLAAATRLVLSLPPGDLHDRLLRQLARARAENDFPAAIAWAATLPTDADRKVAFEDACFQAAEANPGEAVQAWSAIDFAGDDGVFENLVQRWAEKDITAASAWLQTQSPTLWRENAMGRIAFVLAQTQPAQAASYVAHDMSASPAQFEAGASVYAQWRQKDAASAEAWLNQLPAGPLQDRIRREANPPAVATP